MSTSLGGSTSASQQQPRSAANSWAWLALALAAVGTLGSLALSLALGLRACPLCFYQRSFVMGVLAVLAIGVIADRGRASLHSLLALPLAVAGLAIALFHTYLVLSGALECPPGLLALGTAPVQSAAMFAVLTLAMVLAAWFGRDQASHPGAAGLAAMALGLVLAYACIASAPPLPPAPAAPYDPAKQPLDTCRPPYRG